MVSLSASRTFKYVRGVEFNAFLEYVMDRFMLDGPAAVDMCGFQRDAVGRFPESESGLAFKNDFICHIPGDHTEIPLSSETGFNLSIPQGIFGRNRIKQATVRRLDIGAKDTARRCQ